MIDLVICALPPGVLNRAPAAPSVLQSCVEQAGFRARSLDLGLDYFIEQCNRNLEQHRSLSATWQGLTDFDPERSDIKHWIDSSVKKIKQLDPKWAAFSVFSYFQHRATVMLCRALKTACPNIKLVAGGYGISAHTQISFKNFPLASSWDLSNNFEEYLKRHRLVDHIVSGEGESAIVNLLEDKQFGVADPVDLYSLPIPNFDDYKFSEYVWHTQPVITVTGSKGCVRSCAFCNVPVKFGRFRRRQGSDIAQEIIYLSQHYGVTKFEFTDSLVNGSQKDFVEWVTILAEYNDQRPQEQKITWYGQYICRPQNQITNKNIYSLMKRSGAINLVIGMESGSNTVLESMQKKMTVEDMYDELQMFEQHDLQAQLLILVGFYNETWDRFLDTLKFLTRIHKYCAQGTVTRISAGLPYFIEPMGVVHRQAEELGIVLDPTNTSAWTLKNDPSYDYVERSRRKLIMQALLEKMGVGMTFNGINELEILLTNLKIYEQQLRSPDSSGNLKFIATDTH